LVILGNVLDFKTYCASNQTEEDPTTKDQQHLWKKFNRNNIPGDECIAMCYAHGIALNVFRWIHMWCIVKNPDGEILDDLPWKSMVELLSALLAYKTEAGTRRLTGAPHCAYWMLKAQVLNVIKCDISLEKLWNERKGKSSDSLRMSLDEGCTVEWNGDAPSEIHKAGKLFSFKHVL
jgi:hypothetical protein